MKTILVPIDFSNEANYAAKVAASIAIKNNCEIILLHMLDIPSGAVDFVTGNKNHGNPQAILFMKGIRRRFEQFMDQSFFEGIKLYENVKFHKAFEGVIEESKKNDVDLIVMGSQGATGLREMLVGSNTEKVVRQSEIPVLVIKQEVEDFEINEIVYASDFGENCKKAFQNVLDFAKIFNANLHLLFINTIKNFEPTKTTKEKLNDFIADYKMPEHTLNIYNDVTIEEGILNFAKDVDADVIAINTHGRSGLSQLFTESISNDLANHSLRPVVTFKI